MRFIELWGFFFLFVFFPLCILSAAFGQVATAHNQQHQNSSAGLRCSYKVNWEEGFWVQAIGQHIQREEDSTPLKMKVAKNRRCNGEKVSGRGGSAISKREHFFFFAPQWFKPENLILFHCDPLCSRCPISEPKSPLRDCAPVLRLSGQRSSSLPRGIMLMVGPPSLPSLSFSLSLHGPSLLGGSACLRAPMLVLTEHPLIVGISPACLAKLGEGDLRLLWVFWSSAGARCLLLLSPPGEGLHPPRPAYSHGQP